MRVNGLISKSDGIAALLSEITEFGKSIRQVPLAICAFHFGSGSAICR